MLKNSHVRQYIDMMRKAVWGIKRAYPWADYGELTSHAYQIYLEALDSYDPTKGKFSTHLHHKLRALGRPFDPRSAISQEHSVLLSLSGEIGARTNDEAPTLEDIVGTFDANFEEKQILRYFGRLGNPIYLDLCREVLFGDFRTKSINNHNIGKWGATRGLSRPQAEKLFLEFAEIVKKYNGIGKCCV